MIRASNDASIYLDGGGEGVASAVRDPSGLDRVSIGRMGDSSPGSYMSGRVAGPFIYNAALSLAEVRALALGAPPPTIRPQNLVAYWPFMWSDRDALERGLHLTAYNAPTWTPQPQRMLAWLDKYQHRRGVKMPDRVWVQ